MAVLLRRRVESVGEGVLARRRDVDVLEDDDAVLVQKLLDAVYRIVNEEELRARDRRRREEEGGEAGSARSPARSEG